MSWAVPLIRTTVAVRRPLDDAAAADPADLAVGADDPVVEGELVVAGPTARWMASTARSGRRGGCSGRYVVEVDRRPGLDAEDPVELVGPAHAVGGDVPLPAADLGDLLGGGELLLALDEGVEQLLALGVRRDPVQPADPAAVVVAHRGVADQPPDRRPVGPEEVGSRGSRAARRSRPSRQVAGEVRLALLVEDVVDRQPDHLVEVDGRGCRAMFALAQRGARRRRRATARRGWPRAAGARAQGRTRRRPLPHGTPPPRQASDTRAVPGHRARTNFSWVFGHPAISSSSAFRSVWSTLSRQRSLTAVHCRT